MFNQQTVAHEIIDLDANDDPDGVMIICEKASSHKSNHSVSHPSDWPKHPNVNSLECFCLPLFSVLC